MRINILVFEHISCEFSVYNNSPKRLNHCVQNLMCSEEHNYVFVAMLGDETIGIYECEYYNGILNSHGTVVSNKYQKMGIASKLWKKALLTLKPKKIYVTVVSDRGFTLINKVKNYRKSAEWVITEQCGRSLHNLKKSKVA
jgi:predicted GNAT family acetyltransferase